MYVHIPINIEDEEYTREQYRKELRDNVRLIHRRNKEGWEQVEK